MIDTEQEIAIALAVGTRGSCERANREMHADKPIVSEAAQGFDACVSPAHPTPDGRPRMFRLSSRHQLWGLLAIAYVIRLLTIGNYPLTDDTEARYAEIARKMAETGQWIVPQIHYGVPFWGKPPLSFWLTAGAFKLIGVTEFAARIPSLLLSVVVCVLVYMLASRQRGSDYAQRATVVVATTGLMIASAGTVMTDPAMLLGTTLSMVAFWLALTTGARTWGYLFFVGVAIGLLAKGPVATVLTVAPIGVWALLTGRVCQLWRSLPWLTGTAVTALLVVPWYWAAEARTPGFLHYFIVGEHWQRYTVSGWKGDLYGGGHAYRRGTIWLYLLLGTLPWSPWLLWRLIRKKWQIGLDSMRADDGWLIYLLCWALASPVFFTMARNILPTYVLPSLVAFGLLTAEAWVAREALGTYSKVAMLGLLMPALIAVVVFVIWPAVGFQSQKEIFAAYDHLGPAGKRQPLVYIGQRPYSAEFYSNGRAGDVGETQLRTFLATQSNLYFATEASTFKRLPDDLRQQLHLLMTSRSGHYLLLRHDPPKSLR